MKEQETGLPEGWELTTMEKISTVISGGTPNAKVPDNFTEPKTGIAWITPADLSKYNKKYISNGARDLTKQGYKSCSARLMPKGAVLLSSRAPIGYLAIAENDICTNQGFKSFVLNANVDSEYTYFYLKYIRDFIESLGSGTTFKELSASGAKKIPFPLPSLPEQQHLSQKLTALLDGVAEAKQRLEKIHALLKQFRQSVLADAVSGKLTGDDEYSKYRLNEYFEFIDGDRGPNYPKKNEYLEEGYCLFLSTKNVRQFGFDFSEQIFISQEKDLLLRKGKLSRGDIVITTRGTLGYVASYDNFIPFEHIRINSGMLILRKKENNILNEYTKILIASPLFQKMIRDNQTGSAQPQLPAGILKLFEVPIPSVEQQTQIIQKVETYFALANKIETEAANALEKVNLLTQSILAKAFRGELSADWRAENET